MSIVARIACFLALLSLAAVGYPLKFVRWAACGLVVALEIALGIVELAAWKVNRRIP